MKDPAGGRARDVLRRLRDRVQRGLYSPRRFWTRFGRTYMQRFPPVGERGEALIAQTVDDLGVARLLEVGCGYGRYLLALRQRRAFDRLCGVDISPTQIAHARDYLKDFPDVELLVAPAEALPLPDGAFDMVFTYGLMIHLRRAQADAFLEEARRVAQRWGLFIESSNNPDRPHLNPPYYFAHDYAALFRRHGLAVERETSLNPAAREAAYFVRMRP